MRAPLLPAGSSYILTPDLDAEVRAALALGRPLLLKGEPGTGKTRLAGEVAAALDAPLLEWHIKSSARAQQGLYEYDAVSRLRDSQLGDARAHDIGHYIRHGVLWEAFESARPAVVLIDEIDKADLELPNDLLHELDRMDFWVHETRQRVRARHRPLVIITSNNEKELPEAFLRRCYFHFIRFPDEATLERIVRAHFPDLEATILRAALARFQEVRALPGLDRPPSTPELLDWLRLLGADAATPEDLPDSGAGALIKSAPDMSVFQKLLLARAARDQAS